MKSFRYLVTNKVLLTLLEPFLRKNNRDYTELFVYLVILSIYWRDGEPKKVEEGEMTHDPYRPHDSWSLSLSTSWLTVHTRDGKVRPEPVPRTTNLYHIRGTWNWWMLLRLQTEPIPLEQKMRMRTDIIGVGTRRGTDTARYYYRNERGLEARTHAGMVEWNRSWKPHFSQSAPVHLFAKHLDY